MLRRCHTGVGTRGLARGTLLPPAPTSKRAITQNEVTLGAENRFNPKASHHLRNQRFRFRFRSQSFSKITLPPTTWPQLATFIQSHSAIPIIRSRETTVSQYCQTLNFALCAWPKSHAKQHGNPPPESKYMEGVSRVSERTFWLSLTDHDTTVGLRREKTLAEDSYRTHPLARFAVHCFR